MRSLRRPCLMAESFLILAIAANLHHLSVAAETLGIYRLAHLIRTTATSVLSPNLPNTRG